MRRLTRRRLGLGLAGWAGLAALPATLSGCGGGADRTKAQVRLVNATSGYVGLDLVVDGTRRFADVGYGGSEDYAEVDPGNADSELRRPGAAIALLTFTPALAEDRHYTVLAYGGEGELATLLLDDNAGEPDSGKTRLRVVNAAADAGALDVYITGSDEALSGAVPVQAAAAAGSVGPFTTLSSGTRRLRITAAGSKTDVRLDVSGFVLGSEDVSTLVITAGVGGVLVNSLRLDQQGEVVRYDTPLARVRVAAGVAGGASVRASTPPDRLLVSGVRVVGDYLAVSVDGGVPVVTVGGVPVTVPPQDLTAGGDYTLLVYGPAEAPLLRWLVDDNRRPDDSARAKIRLVHGLADVALDLTLDIDGLPVGDGASPGTASLPGNVPASPAAEIVVKVEGREEALFRAGDRTLTASACYTVFVLGSSIDPATTLAVLLRPDR